MSLLPADILYRQNAAASAARVRGSNPSTDSNEGLDVSVALKCIGAHQTWRRHSQLESLDDEQIAAPLIAAARTLLAVAQSVNKTTPERPAAVDGLYMHAAVAYAMHGNFPSAKAAIGDVSSKYLNGTVARQIVAAICDPSRTSQYATKHASSNDEAAFFLCWHKALNEGESVQFDKSVEHFARYVVSANASDTALMLSAGIGLQQAYRLATCRLRETAPELPRAFIQKLIDGGIYTLLPPQRYLLTEAGIARRTGNALLSLPTSTGKTLLAEACMAATVENSDGVAVFIAPYVAIGEQVCDALRRHMPNDVRVVAMFGGYKDEVPVRKGSKQVVVATPERLDAWLRKGDKTELLRLIVFDEVHTIESDVRGTRLEGLLTRIRLMQARNQKIRVLAISAVLREAEELRAWLAVLPEDFHQLSWRPTARRLAIWTSDNRLFWIHGGDALRAGDENFSTRLGEPVNVVVPHKIESSYFPPSDTLASSAAENVAAVAEDLALRLGGAGLVICPRRSDTRLLARKLSINKEKITDDYLKKLSASITARYAWLKPLAECVEKGIAYHNATLPFDIRRDIERAVRDLKVKFVAATTTLAEGADLPFRWTLISHWLARLSGDGSPMNALTFRNIAGRSGRAGAYTEGDTVLYENLLGQTSAVGAGSHRRGRIINILMSQEKLQSTLVSSEEGVDDDRRINIRSMFSSQVMAAIGENPQCDNIVAELAKSTYAGATGREDIVLMLGSAAVEELLDSKQPGGALAVMNSPISLTSLGIAANRTGFSPSTCRKLLKFLDRDEIPSDTSELCEELLRDFNSVPEQNDFVIRRIYNNPDNRALLVAADIVSVLQLFIAQTPVRDIFDALPKRVRTTANEQNLERRFDDFMTVIDGPIRTFLPWLLRGFTILSEFSTGVGKNVEWRSHAKKLEPIGEQ